MHLLPLVDSQSIILNNKENHHEAICPTCCCSSFLCPYASYCFQLFLSDSRYLNNVDKAGGWVACIGGFRFSCNLDEDAQAATGASGGTAPHILKLVDAAELNNESGSDAPVDPAESTAESVTDATTEPSTTPDTEAVTTPDTTSEQGTTADTAVVGTESDTTADEDGCASLIGFGSVAVLVAAAAAVACKLRKL